MELIDRIHDRDGQTIPMPPGLHPPIDDVSHQSHPTVIETVIVIASVVIDLLSTPHAALVLEAIPNHQCLLNELRERKRKDIYTSQEVDETKMIRRMTRSLRRQKTGNVGFIQSIRLIYLTSLDSMALTDVCS